REDRYLFMCTKNGIVKKTKITEYANVRKSGLAAITLKEGDELIEVKATDNRKDILLVTKHGMCIRFNESDVRSTGRTSMGVIGMNVNDGDEIIGMQLDTQGEALLIVSENGLGKRTPIEEFTPQRRGGKGVKCYKINDRSGEVIGFKAVNDDNEIMLITNQGIVIRILCKDISKLGRITTGVKLINMDIEHDVTVASIAKVRQKSAEESESLDQSLEALEKEMNDNDNAEGAPEIETDESDDASDGSDNK
ncbi:MAG: DNA gyrase subunit A, partial [Eubacterium sp.]|nr:DNA gyrase subunit A [Eubacterium sp.]